MIDGIGKNDDIKKRQNRKESVDAILSRLDKRACCLPCQLIFRLGMIGWEKRYALNHVTRDLLSLSTASGR
jgi:hypothetical protein